MEPIFSIDKMLEKSAVRWLSIDGWLALEFLAMYSRLEYALKVSRFRRKGGDEVKADWPTFVNAVSNKFNPERSQRLKTAFAYIQNNPPRRLESTSLGIEWVPCRSEDGSDAAKASRMVSQVRHNLFHGGKFAHEGYIPRDRDHLLVQASIVLLEELISLDDEVERAYDS